MFDFNNFRRKVTKKEELPLQFCTKCGKELRDKQKQTRLEHNKVCPNQKPLTRNQKIKEYLRSRAGGLIILFLVAIITASVVNDYFGEDKPFEASSCAEKIDAYNKNLRENKLTTIDQAQFEVELAECLEEYDYIKIQFWNEQLGITDGITKALFPEEIEK